MLTLKEQGVWRHIEATKHTSITKHQTLDCELAILELD